MSAPPFVASCVFKDNVDEGTAYHQKNVGWYNNLEHLEYLKKSSIHQPNDESFNHNSLNWSLHFIIYTYNKMSKTPIIIGLLALMVCCSSSSAAMMMGDEETSNTTGPSSTGPSSTGPSDLDSTEYWIVSSTGQRKENKMIYLTGEGHGTIGTWDYWEDPGTKWKLIPTGGSNEYWIVSSTGQRKENKMIYLTGEGHGKIGTWDYWEDPGTKWKLTPVP